MKISMKRIAALVVALVMVIGLVPVMNNTADAVALGGLNDTTIGLAVGNDQNWTASENSITGSVTGVKRSNTVYMDAADTLTITNSKATAATLSFDFAVSGYFNVSGSKITIDGTEYTAETSGSFSKELAAGASIEITISAARSRVGINTLNISITKLSLLGANIGPLTTTFEAPAYGSYTVAYGSTEETVEAGKASVTATNESTVQYTLTANPGAGYKFVGWYNVTTGSYISTAATLEVFFDAEATIKAVIVPESMAVFMVGSNYYTDLNVAVAYATANNLNQITLVQSGTLEAVEGGYTIPAGITLLIPRDDENSITPYDKNNKIAPESTTSVVNPFAYKTLTMAEGATLTVNGIVDVEAMHTVLQGASGKVKYGGRVCGAYGAIYMSPNSSITLNNGGILYAFGYVYGNGSITANSGSKVYEIMQVNDFPGGNNLAGFVDKDLENDESGDGIPDNDYLKTFPFSQYYVQNIEVSLTLMHGATEYIFTTIYAASVSIGTAVEFIGSNGMFIPANGSITKDYDPSTDRLNVDVNGDACVSSIVLDMAGTDYANLMQQFIGSDKFDSSRYILSLNSNITINVNTGTTTINQDVSLLPGVRIYVAKKATLEIAEQVLPEGKLNNLTIYGTGGHNVYVWDLENYGKFAYSNSYLTPVTYSPTTGFYTRTYADLEDALVDVNGTVISNGFLYSTVSYGDDFNPISGGAAIISSGKTGKIVLQAGAGEEDGAYCLDGSSQRDSEVGVDSVWLKNGDGTFVLTDGAEPGTAYDYCARHNKWYTGDCEDCATPDSVEITWIVDGEGGPDDVAYGTTPVYPGGTPTKAQVGCTAYTFAGWSTSVNGDVLSELPLATEDAVYYAIFTEYESHDWYLAYTKNNYNGTHSDVYKCLVDGNHWYSVDFDCTDGEDDLPHQCDDCYGEISTCTDGDDKDHNCDYVGCGKENVDGGHHGGTAYCTALAICDECGEEYGSYDLSNHTGELEYTHVDEFSHKVTWSCCGAVVSEEEEHQDWDNDGYCVCGDVFIQIYVRKAKIFGIEMEAESIGIFVQPGTTYTLDLAPADGWEKVCVDIWDYSTDTLKTTLNATQLVLGPEYTSAHNEDLQIDIYGYWDIVFDLNGVDLIEGAEKWYPGYDPENGIATMPMPFDAYTTFDMIKYDFFREGYTLIGVTDGQTTYTGEEEIAPNGEDLHLTLVWKADHVCSENLTEVEAVEADCDTNGVKAYWSCSCGKYYADANASTEIPVLATWKNGDGKIEKLGHGHTAGLYYEEDDENHHTVYCNDCDEAIKGNVKCTDTIGDGDHKCDFCPNENITDHSFDPATHKCECSAVETFTVTWLFNGGVMDEQWKQQLISEGFTVTDTSASGTFPYDDFAPHAPGVTKDGYILIGYTDQYGKFNAGQEIFTLTEDMTYTMVWECAHSDKTYTDLGNGFHKVTCDACSETLVESEGHDYTYDARNHKCQCGAVEEFKLTVVYGINGEHIYEAMVPYWTPMDSLAEINNIPWTVYANDATHFGYFYLDDFYCDLDHDGDLDRDRYFTEGYMPSYDLYVEARYEFNGFVHDGNGWKYRNYGSFYKDLMITLTEADVYENGSDEEIVGFYMVGADGYRIENGMGRWYYLGEWNGVTYEPNAEDLAYCQNNGLTFIDAEKTWYYFGADGKLQFDYTGRVGNSYVINGQAAWHVGLVQIGEDYYYFTGDAVNGGNVMVTGRDYYLSRNNSNLNVTIGGIYTFDNDGKLCRFHGITESELFEGKRYYVGGQLMIGAGLQDVHSVTTGITNYFYVNAYGQLILDAEYYIGANSLGIPKGIYYFDAEGFLVMPEEEPGKNGFYFEDGNWFYYVDGAKGYCAGLISSTGMLWYETADAEGVEIQGWVYVKSNGALATGEYYVTNTNGHNTVLPGDLCLFGNDCLMQENRNGIFNGYYYEDNRIVCGAGLIEIDGNYYYVRSNGQVVAGRTYWVTNVGDTGIEPNEYTFDETGKMIIPEVDTFTGIRDGKYFVDGQTAYGAGLIQIEEGKYIYVRSNGELATGKYWITNTNGELDEGYYTFGEDGILIVE